MSKFNPGDKVKCINDGGNRGIKTGEIYTIKKCWKESISECVTLEENNDVHDIYFAHRFELVKNPVDEAVKLLESHGYTVTKPKPDPQPGQIWVNKYTNAKILVLKVTNDYYVWSTELGASQPQIMSRNPFKDFNDPVSGPGLDK